MHINVKKIPLLRNGPIDLTFWLTNNHF